MADFSLASVGAQAVGAYLSANASANVAANQARATATIRAGNNEVNQTIDARNAVLTATQRWAQKVRNSRVYEAAGNNQEALTTNFNRSRDARTRQNFATSIRQAEESGRQQAAAAASGVTGSVVDVIDMTTQLRNGMQEVARVEAEKQITYDYKKQEYQQRLATLDSLDFSVILDNPSIMQSTQSTPQYTSNAWSAALSTLLTKDNISAIGNSISNFSFGSKVNQNDGSYQTLEDKRLNG